MSGPAPPSQPSIKLEKTFTYRGVPRVFSNRYFLDGGTPADGAHWLTLANAVVAAEKAIYPSSGFSLTITQVIGYAAGSDVPVYTLGTAVAGTLAIGSGMCAPGDCAALVRYSTSARTSKNHPIYLFNYYHGVLHTSALTYDSIFPAQLTALQTYAANWITGFSDGTNTYKRTGPYGHLALGSVVNSFIHHRDFPGG